jgi:hypothetical protein
VSDFRDDVAPPVWTRNKARESTTSNGPLERQARHVALTWQNEQGGGRRNNVEYSWSEHAGGIAQRGHPQHAVGAIGSPDSLRDARRRPLPAGSGAPATVHPLRGCTVSTSERAQSAAGPLAV